MPGFVITFQNPTRCSHQAPATPMPPVGKVLINGFGAVLLNVHKYVIAGCLNPAVSGGPCATALPVTAATRVQSMGQPLAVLMPLPLTQCLPPGTPLLIMPGQTRVFAS
jgi:hypothetical protein